MSTSGQPAAATAARHLGSASALTSLIRSAPAASAARATSALRVSTESGAPVRRRSRVEHRQQPRGLLLGRDLGGAGAVDPAARAGRLGAEVEQVGALVEQLEAVLDGALGIEKQAAVAERIGRDVDDAHDQRPSAEHQPPRARQAQLPASRRGRDP